MILRQRRPPGLLIRTVTVTFVTATALLAVIFFAVMVSVHRQVRSTAQAEWDPIALVTIANHNPRV